MAIRDGTTDIDGFVRDDVCWAGYHLVPQSNQQNPEIYNTIGDQSSGHCVLRNTFTANVGSTSVHRDRGHTLGDTFLAIMDSQDSCEKRESQATPYVQVTPFKHRQISNINRRIQKSHVPRN